MSFFCTTCSKYFTTKQNYNRHLLTNKHLKNLKKYKEQSLHNKEDGNIVKKDLSMTQKNNDLTSNSCPTMSNSCPSFSKKLDSLFNNSFVCFYCQSKYKTQSSLSKHKKKCLQKKIDELESENKQLKIENKQLKDTTNEFTKLALTNPKTNTTNNNSYNIIINQYKDAPNLISPENLQINESLNKYVELGGYYGIISFINKYYGNNIPSNYRSIWCLDPSRDKFLIKYNDEWIIDMEALKFRELTFSKLQKIFYEKQKHLMDKNILDEEGNINDYDLFTNANFLTSFIDKKNQLKVIKDLSKKLHFNKQKSLQDSKNKDEEINNKQNNTEITI